ncbi:MAG: hypothetical protein UDG94_07405 [Peptococcaceae bacterium]|nr:hypothetical protein [Peptococcaceae bacterium]
MKGRLAYWLGAALLALALLPLPSAAAAVLDVNGRLLETTDADSGVMLVAGTTMVSQEVLQEQFYLTLTRDGDAFTLRNAFDDFALTGRVGEKTLANEDDETIALPQAVIEQDGSLYLPLRALAECFGEVCWQAADGRTSVRFDYNNQAALPLATFNDDPVGYEFVVNGGFAPTEDNQVVYDQTDQGTLFLRLNDKGYVVAVEDGGGTVLEPVHEGYGLFVTDNVPAFAIDDDYMYWWEYPLISGTQTSYLYIQSRQKGAEPLLLAESDDVASHDAGYRMWPQTEVAFHQGNVLWTIPNASGDAVEVWLYRSDTGEKTLLDSRPAEDGFGATMQVALGDRVAVWSATENLETLDESDNVWEETDRYGDVFCYDLTSGEISNLSQGYNLLGPVITGDYLIMTELIQDMTIGPKELWVYDLAQGEWKYRIGMDLPPFAGHEVSPNQPIVLDDTHIGLDVWGMGAPYALPVLDLETGEAHATTNINPASDGEALQYMPGDFIEIAMAEGETGITALKPVSKTGTNLATVLTMNDGKLETISHPIAFQW